MKIINARDYKGGIKAAAIYYHSKWGNELNFEFFYDAFKHSHSSLMKLPRFYLMMKNDIIIGCCGLIIYDFVSCGDLYPWFAGLFIEEPERGNEYGKDLLEYTENETRRLGFANLYLTTDHEGFYEKYGWFRIDDAFDLEGKTTRVYKRNLF